MPRVDSLRTLNSFIGGLGICNTMQLRLTAGIPSERIYEAGILTSKDEAKKWIWGALSGLILALAAYLILNTINPDLVSLTPPALQPTGP